VKLLAGWEDLVLGLALEQAVLVLESLELGEAVGGGLLLGLPELLGAEVGGSDRPDLARLDELVQGFSVSAKGVTPSGRWYQ
jgi:hypothetical protein